jgi:hypothetical protein
VKRRSAVSGRQHRRDFHLEYRRADSR